MPNTNRRAWLLGTLALHPALNQAANAADTAFPSRPITLIVPFAPGGIADITARSVAQAMSGALGQPIVVDNRPSAGSIVGSAAVAQAPADGHTLLLMSNANAVSATLFRKLPFDVSNDFAPVGTLAFFDIGLFTGAGSRFKTLNDLLVFARANPGKLTIASISVGSTQQLSAELFKTRTGIDAVIVPYKGSPAVLTALRSGEVDLAFEIVAPMLPQLSAKVVRALAVAAEQRHPAMPEVPTAREAGVANYLVSSWNGLAVPKGTPAAIVARLNAAANAALQSAPVQQQLRAAGVRAQGGTPEQLRALLGSEIRRWAEVITAAHIERQ